MRDVAVSGWRSLAVVFVVVSLSALGSAGMARLPAPVAFCTVPEVAVGDGCPDAQLHVPDVPVHDGLGAITSAASPSSDVVYVVTGHSLQAFLGLHRIGTGGPISDYPVGTGFAGITAMVPLRAAVSHDGASLAVSARHAEGSGGWIVMFDTTSGQVRWAEPYVGGGVATALDFSPNDATLYLAGGRTSAFAAAHDATNGSLVWARSWNDLGSGPWGPLSDLEASASRVIVVGTSAGEQRDIVFHLLSPDQGSTLDEGRVDTGWNEWAKSVVLAPDGRRAYVGFHQGVTAIPLHPSRNAWTTFVPLAGGFSEEWPAILMATADGALIHVGQEVIGSVVQRINAATGAVEWIERPFVPETQLWTAGALSPGGDDLYVAGVGYTAVNALPFGLETVAEMHLTLERFDPLEGSRELPHRADTSPLGWESTWAVSATAGGAAIAGVALPTFDDHGPGEGVALAYWNE